MADNTVDITVKINGVDKQIKSINDLKGAIKDLENEVENAELGSEQFNNAKKELDKLTESLEDFSKSAKDTGDLRKQFEVLEDQLFQLAGAGKQNTAEFKKLTIEAANLNKQIDDVNQSLSGGGAERAEAGFAKFGESLKKLDFKGVAQGAKMMGTALAATGVMLIVQAVGYLVENFEELSQGSGLLAKALRFVGDIIGGIVDGLTFLTDKIGLTNSALEEQGEAIKTNADKAKEALANQTAEYDRQIAVAKASGKNAVDLEIAKQQAIINTNKALVEQTIAYVRNGGVLTEEQNKLLTEQLQSIKNAVAQQDVIRLNETKRIEDENKKQLENFKKLQADKLKEEQDTWNKTLEIRRAFIDGAAADDERLRQEKLAADKLAMEESLAYMQETNAAEKGIAIDSYEFNKKLGLLALEEFKANTDAQLTVAQQGTQSLQNLSDIYFTFKKRNLQKGSAEEEKAARQQFKINKALQLTGAIIDGAKAITSSLAQAPVAIGPIPNPAGIASLALAITSSVASIAKIAATKYEGGASGGGGGSISAPTPSIPSPPTVSTPTNNISGTQFDAQGNTITPQAQQPTITVKAQVVESDMTDTQNTVTKYKAQSTF